MKMQLEFKNEKQVKKIIEYLQGNGVSLQIFLDDQIKKLVQKKFGKQQNFQQKQAQYRINDYLKNYELKFDYFILKNGDVYCQQKVKAKKIKYSLYDDEVYIYLLKKGCPDQVKSIKELQNYSIQISLEQLYDKIYGEGMYSKHAQNNVLKSINQSQIQWKKKHGGRK